jgi:Domain of unknown function (DUF6916)
VDGVTALDHASLAALTGTTLRAEVDGAAIELVVDEVTDPARVGGYESFAVLLTGPPPPLEQATYRMHHPLVGAFDLFVGPVGRDDTGVHYEAVFNRAVEAAT